MPRPSYQSYQDFVRTAFAYLEDPGPVRLDDALAVHDLYDLYASYDPDPTVPAKVRLVGNPLYQAMIAFINNANNADPNRIIRVQSDDWSIMDKAAALAFYNNPPPGGPALSAQARTALTSYLHVYPAGTTRRAPGSNHLNRAQNRRGDNNWRIGINVLPGSIAAAVLALMPIMNANRHIDHIKFSAPGTAGKPDSVIIYMRKRTATYDTIKGAVQAAIPIGNVQAIFSPMWNEFAPGFAEAAEPPKNGGSFGTYRCILAYLAYPRHPSTAATLRPSDYLARVDQTFGIFGIPLVEPHKQEPLVEPPYDSSIRKRFMRARALHKGKPTNHFHKTKLRDR